MLSCASGTHEFALAAGWVRQGRADVVLAGGTDFLCRFVVAGFNCLRATAERARPFDVTRRGLVLGEGAAIVVVEEAGHAARRGARLLARLAGVGCAADATHMTAPDREGGGATRALLAALDDAGLSPAAVDFVSAHGTGTPYNDAMEAVALARVFGAGRVPVNSIKGAIGHTLGAAGALEAVLCVETLARGIIPPTAALEPADRRRARHRLRLLPHQRCRPGPPRRRGPAGGEPASLRRDGVQRRGGRAGDRLPARGPRGDPHGRGGLWARGARPCDRPAARGAGRRAGGRRCGRARGTGHALARRGRVELRPAAGGGGGAPGPRRADVRARARRTRARDRARARVGLRAGGGGRQRWRRTRARGERGARGGGRAARGP